jgi:tetratricopeptide (TPR) repeat protein
VTTGRLTSEPLRRGSRNRYDRGDDRERAFAEAPVNLAMPPRRAPRPSTRRDGRKPSKAAAFGAFPTRRVLAIAALTTVAALSFGAWIARERDRPRRLLEAAEAASIARDWPQAANLWNQINQAPGATARTLLAEARADLELDRAAGAAQALERASIADPTRPEVWRARLDLLRVLDRPLEALKLARKAEETVKASEIRPILASATLAALAELPDDEARDRLNRWIKADPDDLDARVARLSRIGTNSHPGDPDRASRIAELAAILDREPGHLAAREALLVALADAGEPDRGRAILESWPEAARDAPYFRLRGRWDLDYDHQPDRAAQAYARVLLDLPHDWKSHYGLARAYRALGREPEAQTEARAVARLRERLAPATLAPRLTGDLTRLDDPRALLDLAALSESVGLTWLAEAWAREALPRPSTRGPPPTDR